MFVKQTAREDKDNGLLLQQGADMLPDQNNKDNPFLQNKGGTSG